MFKVKLPIYKKLLHWITERHSIYMKRRDGSKYPWTKDPILRDFRFCNVYRELDTVTVWIRENWREPFDKDKDLWFAMVVARLLNQPDSLEAVGFPTPWAPKNFQRILKKREEQGLRVFNAAYIVSTNGVAMNKVQYIAERVLTPMWINRGFVRPGLGENCQALYEKLMRFDGMGSFMAAQVVADMKHTSVMSKANDIFTFVASGPGSRRGLNRMVGREVKSPWREHEWREVALEIGEKVNYDLPPWMDRIDMQDFQNCLCEFDKYMRATTGEGKPKQRYTP